MFKKVKKDATLPTRESKYSACVDVYANENVIISAGETKLVRLGITIDFSDNWKYKNGMVDSFSFKANENLDEHQSFRYFKKSHYLQLMLRSSLGKKGLIIPNGVGVVDLNYEDEIKIIVYNSKKVPFFKKILDFIFLSNFPISSSDFLIKKGDKIDQLTLLEHKSYLFEIESEEERSSSSSNTDKKKNNV